MKLPFQRRDGALSKLIGPLIIVHRKKLILVILVMPVSSVLAMIVPYLIKVAIDDYIIPGTESGVMALEFEPLYWLAGLAMVVVLGGYLADAIYVSTVQRMGQSLIADLREIVFQRTLRLPRAYFDTHPIGTVLTRVTSDIEALGESLATGSLALVIDFLKTLAYLSMMFALNWRLTLVLLLILPLLVLLIAFFQSRVRRTFFIARQALSEATGYLQESLSGIKTVQLYGAEQLFLKRFKEKNRKFYQAQNSSNFYDALLFSLVEGVTSLSLALVLWYAAGELLTGFLTLGVLVAFLEYIQRLLVPVREFTQQLAVLQRAMAALDHINELCQVPLDPAEEFRQGQGESGGESAEKENKTSEKALSQGKSRQDQFVFQSLQFNDVRFRYQPKGQLILKGISLGVNQGKTLAVVGATGSGKSTLIRLLTRAYGGYQGSISINGNELRDIPAEWLSGFISIVHQNVFLFRGSVAFNISLGRDGMDRERIEQAAKYVNAHNFITKLEGDYDFEILQGGANLSAGEGQLISLARAVYAETELIILDEATSSVDSITESLIQKAVGKLYRDKTVIAIAHRLSTIRNADTILVMDNGRIAETGSHDELITQEGIYASLVGELERKAQGDS